MKFKLSKTITAPKPVRDPFGLGIEFYLRPPGSSQIQAIAEKDTAQTRLAMAILPRVLRGELGQDDLDTMTDTELAQALTDEEIKAAYAVPSRPPVEAIAAALEGWSGVHDAGGEVVLFSAEAAVELLSIRDELEEFPDVPVGYALQDLIIAEAARSEQAARAAIRALVAKQGASPDAADGGARRQGGSNAKTKPATPPA